MKPGTSLAVSGYLRLCLPLQGVWVQSLVRELRFHMPQGMAKKIKNKDKCYTTTPQKALKDSCHIPFVFLFSSCCLEGRCDGWSPGHHLRTWGQRSSLMSWREPGSLRILWSGIFIWNQDFCTRKKVLPCSAPFILGLC